MSRLVDADVPGAKVLKALTLWQPWASLCVIERPCDCPPDHPGLAAEFHRHGCGRPFKTIETRSWPAPKSLIGQRIAIHAAKRPMRAEEPIGQFDAITRSLLRDSIAGESMSREERLLAAVFPDGHYIHELPFGAVLGTAVLADCVPMANPRWTDPVRPYLWVNEDEEDAPHDLVLYRDGVHGENVSDQAPFGHFEQGRWAWLLADVERFDEPIPARGGQRIWNWEPS